MNITKIFSFLVPPGKHVEIPIKLNGTEIPLTGKLFNMLKEVYDKSSSECDIPICFKPDDDGNQHNPIRDNVINLLKNPNIANGLNIANRLYSATTRTSGLGLLFLMIGKEANSFKIVISRFPADHGITAEENRSSLKVTFIERVFLKNAHTYKSVLYSGEISNASYWEGLAVDRQLIAGIKELSDYWIKGFLLSDFKTTPKDGTKRLSTALRAAINKTDELDVKQEIVAAAVLAKNLANRTTSIEDFCEQHNLSSTAKKLVMKEVKRKELAVAKFVFDYDEFSKNSVYKSVQLHNEVTLIAPTDKFDHCFESEVLNIHDNEYRYITQGKIINTNIRKSN
ncbi:MAG TPA: hypothetical protein VF857_05410 [Spirochaetota bacterium]